MSCSRMAKVKFNNGNYCPMLGLGTWQSAPGSVGEAVKKAIDIGYRHIDCSPIYENEKEIGQALKSKIDDETVTREDLFITSKLWNTNHHPDKVEAALTNTLNDLCVDYLDLYLIHWPLGFAEGYTDEGNFIESDDDYVDTWKAMEDMLEKGLVKNIGLSNFNSKQIERLLRHSTVTPVVNQVECHPYLTQIKLSDFCQSKEIVLTAYSPLGSPDRPWAKPEDAQLINDERLRSIADNYDKTTAQVVLRYQIDRGHIVIPKTVSESRMIENFDIMNFKLSQDDIELINSFDCNGRICALEMCSGFKYYPFNIEY
ncbi:aldo-keto reductase family 1 member B1-like [Aphidius gifuensis]|uniref:aldo-keto reductase family 1 member B1-like n=1 Tax=Aphidius gifuensis TaxID=684658 RepID=UPI001CDB8350|nr:aldo-keto reductase family 1 member B1-like [Aphidius gifuensis]XP_044002684.1 aldo-keto reductase family 1 member B1-like [Aphidius gifuensis]